MALFLVSLLTCLSVARSQWYHTDKCSQCPAPLHQKCAPGYTMIDLEAPDNCCCGTTMCNGLCVPSNEAIDLIRTNETQCKDKIGLNNFLNLNWAATCTGDKGVCEGQRKCGTGLGKFGPLYLDVQPACAAQLDAAIPVAQGGKTCRSHMEYLIKTQAMAMNAAREQVGKEHPKICGNCSSTAGADYTLPGPEEVGSTSSAPAVVAEAANAAVPVAVAGDTSVKLNMNKEPGNGGSSYVQYVLYVLAGVGVLAVIGALVFLVMNKSKGYNKHQDSASTLHSDSGSEDVQDR